LTTNTNLFGHSGLTIGAAFYGFTPSASDLIATSDAYPNTNPNRPAHVARALLSILNPLTDNGGFTQTHALPDGSPAANRGDNAVCSSAPINNLDQRGEARDANCDIGSYEDFDEGGATFVIPLKNGKVVIFTL
jgi:hypothetical protein